MKQSVTQYYSQNPKIYFEPEEPESEQECIIYEMIVNKKWDDLKMKQVCRDTVKSTKLYGLCGLKTYFNFKKNSVKEEWTDRIQNDEVRTDRVPLTDLLRDPDAKSFDKSPWIAHEITAKVDDIVDKFNIKREYVTVTKSTKNTSDYATHVKSDFQYGTYYEIEDRKNEKIFYIVDGLDKFAKRPEDKKYSYDTMYDFLMYNDLPDRPEVLSDYAFWRDQLMNVALFQSMQLTHAKKGTAKYKVLGGTLTPEAKNQLKSSNDSTIVELPPGVDVQRFDHSNIDPAVQYAEASCRNDIQLISKQAPRQTSGSDKTATEVKAVEMAAQRITSENLDRLEEVMGSIATKWATLMRDNYTTTRAIGLSGMPEAQFSNYKGMLDELMTGTAEKPFVKITKKNIDKKVKAKIKAGSTTPDTEQTRMAKLQGFAGFVANAQLQGGLDQNELLKQAAEVFGVENYNILVQKDNPMEESKLLNSSLFISPRIQENHVYHLTIHDRESNGNDQNIAHRLGHLMFKSQLEKTQMAQAVTAQNQMQSSGQSFMGMGQGPLTPEALAGNMQQGAQAQPAAMPQPGGVNPPQGG